MEKKVKVFIDLYPGWHDTLEPFVCASVNKPITTLSEGSRRYCIEVSLPCFGGSADAERTIYPPRDKVELTEDRSRHNNKLTDEVSGKEAKNGN